MKSKKTDLKKNLIIAAVIIVLYALLLVADYRIDQRQKAEALANTPLSTETELIGMTDLSVIYELEYSAGTVSGIIGVQNNGKTIENISGGAYPIRIGISLIDADENILCLDYWHMDIKEGNLEKQERADNPILFESLDEYEGCVGMRIAVVQENVAWLDDTAVVWMFNQ